MQKGQNKYNKNKQTINYQIKDNLENILILSFHSQQMFYKAVCVIKGILRTFLIAVFTTKMFYHIMDVMCFKWFYNVSLRL